ncbi:MAG: hypothetical protein ABR926_03210 [Streptosporangiaceae bacterium]
MITGPDPVVQGLDAAVYVVPTDAPEADGTLAWDKTTLVLVTASAAASRASAGATRPRPRLPW